jgi:ubiquinone/menaquinone biosynthesis C-methylase UbiE
VKKAIAIKGQVAIPLIEATSNPVVMLDPDVEAMSKGVELARKKGLEDRLFAVVGVAEDMPLPDNSVDLVVSHGPWLSPMGRPRVFSQTTRTA